MSHDEFNEYVTLFKRFMSFDTLDKKIRQAFKEQSAFITEA